jgi:hypothetical protein
LSKGRKPEERLALQRKVEEWQRKSDERFARIEAWQRKSDERFARIEAQLVELPSGLCKQSSNNYHGSGKRLASRLHDSNADGPT